jgi:hypothetical protein
VGSAMAGSIVSPRLVLVELRQIRENRLEETSPPAQSCVSWNRSAAVPRAGLLIQASMFEEAGRITGEVTLSRSRQ